MKYKIAVLLGGALVAGASLGQSAPWIERVDLQLALNQAGIPAPTTADRLARAEVLIVADFDLTWEPANNRWRLDVDPWTTLHGWQNSPPLCDPNDPFYGQPTTGFTVGQPTIRGCSGFLVGPDLVVSAGHCIGPPPPMDPWETTAAYPCPHRYVVFDFADLGPVGPSQDIYLQPEQVVACSQVKVDTIQGPETELQTDPPSAGDRALLELASSVDRLPFVIERFPQRLALGHPARIPRKAELATVTSTTGGTLLHALGGSSGSPRINLETGKVYGNLTHSSFGWTEEFPCPDPPEAKDLCFECEGALTTGTRSTFWLADVPPIGLQVVPPPDNKVDYYGPPTDSGDYEPWSTVLSVPAGSLPPTISEVTWAIQQEGGPLWFEVVNGPSNGTLGDGASVAVTMLPADWLVAEPGLYEMPEPVFDFTYGTRSPFLHRAHVGVDGFTLFPADDFDGPEGLGVPHGALREYAPANRWVVTQGLTVTASARTTAARRPSSSSPTSASITAGRRRST